MTDTRSLDRSPGRTVGQGDGTGPTPRDAWWRPPSVAPRDLVVGVVLALICLLAWCAANAKWSAASWGYPTTYAHDPERGDFLSNAAYLKGSADWGGLPFLWKTVGQLGAPHDANWNDFPSLDEVTFTIQGALARTLGLFRGMNTSFVIAHMLAAIAMYAAARMFRIDRLWAALAGLAFGVAPFIFAQSPHHTQVALVWPIAFFPLVWRTVATSPGLAWGSRSFWLSVAFAFVTGLHFVYYTNIFCQLVLLGAVILWVRTRDSHAFRTALALVAAAAIGFALNNVDGWTYRLTHDANPGAFVREYKWLEIYGLKLVDLFIPPVNHRFGAFAAFATAHRSNAPLLDEGASYLGIVGLCGLAWVVVDALRAGMRGRFEEVPIEAWWLLWIVLMFTTGGLNAILGAGGFTMFRAACRYSIVILAIVLLYAARRLTMLQATAAAGDDRTQGVLWGTIAALAGLTILWDQVPRPPAAEYVGTVTALVDSDRRFAGMMEAALPEGAMVFQFPVMEFPESPAPGLGSYEHFRPYLYSSKLRYSFGSQKGRDREAWQKEVAALPFDKAVPEIARRGFSAIYINRRGYPDGGQALENSIRELGYTQPLIRSPAGDLDCIPLQR